MKRDFLTFEDLKTKELNAIIARAVHLKKLVRKKKLPQTMRGKTLVMIFEKSSTRTRVSFEAGISKLGGNAIHLTSQDSQIGRGESYEDTARVLSRYADLIMMRTYAHEPMQRFAAAATVPVINGLTDLHHPCQVVADLVTLQEKRDDLKKLKIAWVGDGNNMAHSWIQAAGLLGFTLHVVTPLNYEVNSQILASARGNKKIVFFKEPREAVQGVDVINTDTWFSMGQEVSDEKRAAFSGFQVNDALLACAKKNVLVMHCLPAHRGEEITDEVLDGKHSIVFDQAENRLYAQMAIMELLTKN